MLTVYALYNETDLMFQIQMPEIGLDMQKHSSRNIQSRVLCEIHLYTVATFNTNNTTLGLWNKLSTLDPG